MKLIGDDYDSGPYIVIIPAGLTSASFDVLITNDGILEDDESFILIINSSSVPIGDSDQAMITIMDDDGKQIVAVTLS